MVETPEYNYEPRTKLNVDSADGTMLIIRGRPDRGTLLTWNYVKSKPGYRWCMIDLDEAGREQDPARVQAIFMDYLVRSARAFISGRTLFAEGPPLRSVNIAGPSESKCPGIYVSAYGFLMEVLQRR
jgi:hypothetical protein